NRDCGLFSSNSAQVARLTRCAQKRGSRPRWERADVDRQPDGRLTPGVPRSPRPIRIAPSLLSAAFERLGGQVVAVVEAGAGYLPVDVMDGRFVPNITIGPPVVEALRRVTDRVLDTHLMIVEPERYVEDFARAGSDIITVHVEACIHLHRVLQQIR